MERDWATFGRDLHLELALRPAPGARPRGLRTALTAALRDAVRDGRLAPGTRLPSSRSLAPDLGIARNTVAEAYADLVAEGWLTARQGSGTRVAEAPAPTRTTSSIGATPSRRTRPTPPRHDLTPGTPDLSAFPRSAWLAAARRALTAAPNEALGYCPPGGHPALREALADYLARARGVRTTPERVVVCAGFMQGLRAVARVLRAAGVRAAGTEAYGLPFHRQTLLRTGLRTAPLAVDQKGAVTAELTGLRHLRTVLLTPAHQFPTGVALHPERRAEVVAWAREADGMVLEDDYDGEFRYDRQPVGALQGLAPDRVVYLGTASKSLAPGLRLAWLVVPERLLDPVLAAMGTPHELPLPGSDLLSGLGEGQAGTFDQLTLAEFLTSGAYDRHVRGMRLHYRRRRDRFVAAVREHAPHLRVTGIAAGLHALLELEPGTERSVVRGARWHGLTVTGLADFTAPGTVADRDALVVPYGRPPEHAFPQVLDALLRALPPA
ncbi:PLP-dependent aminotransferase family protein [Streptomyces sp. NPDC059740]|uniref:MocR-like pyridoxine biosynthesis transcription factor PdxR n=1 Tax=Streptomyces sp. NPDC059740 TaxID=3346926 RepID=UPI003658689D